MAATAQRMTLFDLTLEGMMIHNILVENEGELDPATEARLDELMRQGPDRMEAAAAVVRHLEADMEVCKAEARRLMARARSFENQAVRLKGRMVLALDAAFSGKLKTARFTIWNQTSAPTVAFDLNEGFTPEMLEQELPEAVRTKKELDKAALKSLYEAGAQLPEAIFVEEHPGTRYIQIR